MVPPDLPETHVLLPGKQTNPARVAFRARFATGSVTGSSCYWIAKPDQGNSGVSIVVSNLLSEIEAAVDNSNDTGHAERTAPWVVQQYVIEPPPHCLHSCCRRHSLSSCPLELLIPSSSKSTVLICATTLVLPQVHCPPLASAALRCEAGAPRP
jgi:hypothetical protein